MILYPNGYYQVKGQRFVNKIDACRHYDPAHSLTWHFHDDVFGCYDWTQEPEQDLYDLYRMRAHQLRNKYERVILLYSGGIDSTTMLRTFVDNNIPFEGIASYGSFGHDNWKNFVQNQEVLRVAIPYIKKLEAQHGRSFNYFFIDDTQHFDRFKDESWVLETSNFSLSPQTYLWNFHGHDANLQAEMMKGKVCLVRGVDKPRIFYEQGSWQVAFLDSCPGFFNSSTNVSSWQAYDTEYFYWTPDMPAVIAKQAYVISQYFDRLPASPIKQNLMSKLFSRDRKIFDREFYHDFIDPLIYGRYVNQQVGHKRPYFTLGKAKSVNAWDKDDTFFTTADTQTQQKWRDGVEWAWNNLNRQLIKQADSVDSFIQFGLVDIWSRSYRLG